MYVTCYHHSVSGNIVFFTYFQEETDERGVELQSMVQSVTQAEAEIQHMFNLLQDLESSMNNSKQRQEEVKTRHKALSIQISPILCSDECRP